MNIKKILFALIVTTLLLGSVCAASVNDLKVDGYSNAYDTNYNSAYLNGDGSSGVYIYKNINGVPQDQANGHYEWDDDGYYEYDYDDDGYGYHAMDDDTQITKNSDNTATFKDYDDGEHGVTEVIEIGGEKYTVVFWAKDTSSMDNTALMAKLTEFNKDNGVTPIAF